MRQQYIAVIPLCAILIVTGCTTESAPKEVGGSISKITAKGDDSQEVQAESRTTLDDYSVV